ncbi:MAG: tRNA uridine-5-carboxymethylaminomethyl(34) synthesis GTPase MnmE [Deltaproteobacteria bacterium]|nr:tRNA uridine-5-carboxymethylaminomethyl(34) synthesis GTPase MnmE [Deltaproteobacteria bacterium]
MEDTIAAIATPPGVGGIGIIRVSGPKSMDIARLLFRSSKRDDGFKSHHLYHGDIVSPETGLVIDEVLISLMMKPHSYTGEDVLEINCHGGSVILQSVLSEVIIAGARLAEPGEFTRRAFLNNRIDLIQAESIVEMIMAKTDRGLELAVSHLKGNLAEKIETIRASIIDILAIIETSIDFSDEDIEISNYSDISRKIETVIDELHKLVSTYREGKIYRDGINAVIAGRPNVGKSSLLNRLLGEKRAIITPLPGTTRDFIEEIVNIRGVPVKLTDTAGIREPENIIEKEGVRLVWEKLSQADVAIIVLDGNTLLTKEDTDIIERCRAMKRLLVINKADLSHMLDERELTTLIPDTIPLIWISAKYGDGIPELKDAIYSIVLDNPHNRQSAYIISNIRHKTAIEKTAASLLKARDAVESGLSPEFYAFDVREALDSLGEIGGKTATEEILDRIFSTFCIGK